MLLPLVYFRNKKKKKLPQNTAAYDPLTAENCSFALIVAGGKTNNSHTHTHGSPSPTLPCLFGRKCLPAHATTITERRRRKSLDNRVSKGITSTYVKRTFHTACLAFPFSATSALPHPPPLPILIYILTFISEYNF